MLEAATRKGKMQRKNRQSPGHRVREVKLDGLLQEDGSPALCRSAAVFHTHRVA